MFLSPPPPLGKNLCALKGPEGLQASPRQVSSPTGSPRQPDPRPGRRRARFSSSLPALALLLGALSPFAATPAAADSLVENIGESHNARGGLLNNRRAQQFTTGSNAFGYTLTSIDYVAHSTITNPERIRAVVLGVAANGLPDTSNVVATLTRPSGQNIPAGIAKFTAPANTVLQPDTSYFAALLEQSGTRGPSSGTISYTTSANQLAITGWSIADNGYRDQLTVSSQSWGSINFVMRLRVDGTIRRGRLYRIAAATANEGANAELTVTLGEAAQSAGLTFNVSYDYSGSAATEDTGSTPSTVKVTGGSTTAKLVVRSPTTPWSRATRRSR